MLAQGTHSGGVVSPHATSVDSDKSSTIADVEMLLPQTPCLQKAERKRGPEMHMEAVEQMVSHLAPSSHSFVLSQQYSQVCNSLCLSYLSGKLLECRACGLISATIWPWGCGTSSCCGRCGVLVGLILINGAGFSAGCKGDGTPTVSSCHSWTDGSSKEGTFAGDADRECWFCVTNYGRRICPKQPSAPSSTGAACWFAWIAAG